MVWNGRILVICKKFVLFELPSRTLPPGLRNCRYFCASKRKNGVMAVGDQVLESLVQKLKFNTVAVTDALVSELLHRFQDDWKSALSVFRLASSSSPSYEPRREQYDKLVDILGKAKQMDKMKALIDEMCEKKMVSLSTIAKVMRRYAGARDWQAAVTIFDDLEAFGLRKDTEAMNLLLDTLSKERRVEQARKVFLELKPHIPPNANTYNIFIHGWCKVNRVEEAQWTIQEMKGEGFKPCVISYSTIVEFYCSRSNFDRVYELFEDMRTEGCPPNVVTFTTLLHYLTKAGKFGEALEVREKMKEMNCRPDTKFYNALLHTLGRAGRIDEAVDVFTRKMQRNGVEPSTSTYNTMIAMFCHHRQEKRALEILSLLEESPCCKPDAQSFHPLLKACLRDGKAGECLDDVVDAMVEKHHLCLDLGTFTLLIHGLCRAKSPESAYRLFRAMAARSLRPRYNTCSLLLREARRSHMYEAAEMVEEFMKTMK